MIKKILFPVDFSDSCLGAARYVEALAGRFEAEIMLLHVVGMGEHNLAEDLLPQRQARLDAFLADELKYFTTQRLCVTGDDPETEIIGAAQYWGPDLVTMPTHGLGAFRRLLLGSITAKVLHDLECPVWTGVHSEAAPPLEDIHCRRILCAMDLTEHSHRVLQWAARLAGECQASLGIVHATAELPTEFYSVKLAEDLARSVTEHTEQEKRQIQILQTAAGTAGQVFIKSGDPAKVVACAARNFDADLLVIGRHGETGIAGYLRQSAYSILRDSPCPVISI